MDVILDKYVSCGQEIFLNVVNGDARFSKLWQNELIYANVHSALIVECEDQLGRHILVSFDPYMHDHHIFSREFDEGLCIVLRKLIIFEREHVQTFALR